LHTFTMVWSPMSLRSTHSRMLRMRYSEFMMPACVRPMPGTYSGLPTPNRGKSHRCDGCTQEVISGIPIGPSSKSPMAM
jgi:hypothetical protein